MILMLEENGDYSSDLILEWIISGRDINFCRINTGDYVLVNQIVITEKSVSFQLTIPSRACTINSEEILFFLCRRGLLGGRKSVVIEDDSVSKNINYFLRKEESIYNEFLLDFLKTKKRWGNSNIKDTNKLINLKIAASCGFKIPKTIISEEVSIMELFCKENKVITKPISEIYPINDMVSFVDLITKRIDSIENCKFSVSQLQEEIVKWIEIRVFVTYNDLFSMAIFSQTNTKTTLDYRNYDRERMNRMVPYKLPIAIRRKVLGFMNKIGLDTGSIDLIVTPEKEYFFLEVNPEGIFEMVSEPCNYYIEKRIAEQILEMIPL